MLAPTGNPALHPALRIFSAGVIIVLLVGAGLFLTPGLVRPRWPWAVAPFNARFLGSFYIAEIAVMMALLVWNRWAPGRLVLVMAFVFTAAVSVVSFWHLEIFDFGRKSPWLWFAVYLVSVVISGFALVATRNNPAPSEIPVSTSMRRWLRAEGAALTAYGLVLLFVPLVAASFWPWQIDQFHAQTYSAVFLSGGAGALLVASRPVREELLVLGLAEVAVGGLSIAGLLLTDAEVHRVTWSGPGTFAWLALFALIGISGVWKLATANRYLR